MYLSILETAYNLNEALQIEIRIASIYLFKLLMLDSVKWKFSTPDEAYTEMNWLISLEIFIFSLLKFRFFTCISKQI